MYTARSLILLLSKVASVLLETDNSLPFKVLHSRRTSQGKESESLLGREQRRALCKGWGAPYHTTEQEKKLIRIQPREKISRPPPPHSFILLLPCYALLTHACIRSPRRGSSSSSRDASAISSSSPSLCQGSKMAAFLSSSFRRATSARNTLVGAPRGCTL